MIPQHTRPDPSCAYPSGAGKARSRVLTERCFGGSIYMVTASLPWDVGAMAESSMPERAGRGRTQEHLLSSRLDCPTPTLTIKESPRARPAPRRLDRPLPRTRQLIAFIDPCGPARQPGLCRAPKGDVLEDVAGSGS